MPCHVVIAALPEMNATSLAVTLQALDGANRIAERLLHRAPPFRVEVCSVDGAPIHCGPGEFRLPTKRLRAQQPDVIVVPGTGAVSEPEVIAMLQSQATQKLCQWLARRSEKHVAASCTGVFVIAKAGLLDGLSATTTWWLAPTFAALFPKVRLDRDAMLVDESRRTTAGAALAQLDLILHLIARHAGPTLADLVARYLVVDARPSQARYIVPSHLAATSPEVTAAERWVRRHLHEPFTIPNLAKDLGTSARTLSRRIIAANGESPLAMVRRIRVETARHLLATTKLSVEAIAERVGYEDPATLRRAFARFGERPSDLRKAAGRKRR